MTNIAMNRGQCQRGGCTNVGNRVHIVVPKKYLKARRGLPAGERWYCAECAQELKDMLGIGEGTLVSIENLTTGEIIVPAKGMATRQ